MNFTASTLNAASVRAATGQKLADQRAREKAHEAATASELVRLRKMLSERLVKEQALELIVSLIEKAVERGDTEVLIMSFPSSWLADHGRAINNEDKDWPEKLDGFARRAYEYYAKELRPREFEIRAAILDWPDGMPGDVGLFLSW